MVIGLLHDKMTYFAGFGYLMLYNLILILPLVVVLWISADKAIVVSPDPDGAVRAALIGSEAVHGSPAPP